VCIFALGLVCVFCVRYIFLIVVNVVVSGKTYLKMCQLNSA